VTGNNAQWIKDKKIMIGSEISIGKAGEIIPKIIDVKSFKDEVSLPAFCPKCKKTLSWEGVHLVCYADNCIAKQIVSIAYFYSHKGIKVDGIGEGLIEKILENEKCYSTLIDKPWALLDMQYYGILSDVVNSIGSIITGNILTEISQVNGTKHMAHFVAGLGLPGLAYKSALKLCHYIKTGELSSNVPVKARIHFPDAVSLFEKASSEMINFSFAPIPSPAKAKYCITGSLSISREAMIEVLNEYSFEFSSTVTKDTDYLIVGDAPGKTKINKAIKYSIPQITESQLKTLLKENKDG
jgi:DNA ligase (NAD+)